MLVAQVPRHGVAVIHDAVILLGRRDDARILLGGEEGLAILHEIVEPLVQEIEQRVGDRPLAKGIAARQRHAAVADGLGAPRREAAIALARDARGLGIDLVEISEHGLDGGAEAVDVEPVEAALPVGIATLVDGLEPVQERADLAVPPHPGGEAREGRLRHLGPRQPAHIGVIDRGIRPIGFDRDDIEAVLLDQHRSNRRAGVVELGRAMRRLAEQHHALMGEALGEAGQLVEIAERLCRLGDEVAQLVRMALARCAGISSPSAKPELSASISALSSAPGSAQPSAPIRGTKVTAPKSSSSKASSLDAADANQRLMGVAADRDDQPPADGELAASAPPAPADRRPRR